MIDSNRGSAFTIILVVVALLGITAGAVMQKFSQKSKFIKQLKRSEAKYGLRLSALNHLRRRLKQNRWWKANGTDTYPLAEVTYADRTYTIELEASSFPLRKQGVLKLTAETFEEQLGLSALQQDPGLFTVFAANRLEAAGGRIGGPVYGKKAELKNTKTQDPVFYSNKIQTENTANETKKLRLTLPAIFPYSLPEAAFEEAQKLTESVISFRKFENRRLKTSKNIRLADVTLNNSGLYGKKQITLGKNVKITNPPVESPVVFGEKTVTIKVTKNSSIRGALISNKKIVLTGEGTVSCFLTAPVVEIRGGIEIKPFQHRLRLNRKLQLNTSVKK